MLQRDVVWHREYSQYFKTTLNGVQQLKIVNHNVVFLKLI